MFYKLYDATFQYLQSEINGLVGNQVLRMHGFTGKKIMEKMAAVSLGAFGVL